MFSQSAEYALRAVTLLAQGGERRGGRQLAADLRLPGNYLSKILLQLCRAGVLTSRKGWGGGFALARDPLRIKVKDVISPFESAPGPRACPLGKDRCNGGAPCAMHGYMAQINGLYQVMTDRVTIGDLIAPPSRRGRR